MQDTPIFEWCQTLLNARSYAPKATVLARHFVALDTGADSASSKIQPFEWQRAAGSTQMTPDQVMPLTPAVEVESPPTPTPQLKAPSAEKARVDREPSHSSMGPASAHGRPQLTVTTARPS